MCFNCFFTSPTFVTEKAKKEKREFYIPRLTRERNLYGTEFEIKLRNELTQKAIARECAEWIRQKVTFKSNVSDKSIQGQIVVDGVGYTPINNFTTVELGCEKGNVISTTIVKDESLARTLLADFNEIWNDSKVLQVVTDEVIDSITAAYNENSPDFIYFVTLYNIFSEFLEDVSEDVLPNEATGFKESKIWGMLYNFQRDAALAIINKLEKYNGCILADSVTSEYFKGKYVKVNDVPTLIDNEKADAIEFYLIQNSYVDMKRRVTDKYRRDVAMNQVAELPDELKPMSEGIHTLVQAVYDDSILKDMFTDGHESKVKENPLNENFAKKEFQALWREINHKYAYTVEFDSAELIRKAIAHIDEKLFVSELQYTTTIGRQKANMNEYEIDRGDSFTGEKTRTQTLKHAETSQIKYDLIGKIADGAKLTRKSASAILQGIRADKLYMFKNNPEEFISKVIRLINEQKATMIVEHISYNTIEGEYDSSIFTAEKATQSFDKAFLAKKAIQDYVFTDGSADKSIERKFAEDLDAADEVCVYAKLPRTFQIPTPVGNYSPDWAIAFYEGTVKHIFFVAETKGTMETLELRPIEQAKISCAKKLFNEMSTSHVVYHDVDSYQSLLNIMNSI